MTEQLGTCTNCGKPVLLGQPGTRTRGQLTPDGPIEPATIMHADCATAPTALPELSGFETYYGVRIGSIGEDGDVMALGHVEPRRFVAAHIRYCREDLGYNLAWEMRSPELAFKDIEHTWMVEDPEEAKNEGATWWLRIATVDEPGAFPATYWSA